MPESGHRLAERLHREAIDQLCAQSRIVDPEPDLPDVAPNSSVAPEWDIFRREVEQLIADGHRNRFALVKVGHAITVWDTLRDALQASQILYGSAPCLVQQILPYLRSLRPGNHAHATVDVPL